MRMSVQSATTQFVPLPAGLVLASDTDYSYTVRCDKSTAFLLCFHCRSVEDSASPPSLAVLSCGGATATAAFSTGLLDKADWASADFIGGVCAAGSYAWHAPPSPPSPHLLSLLISSRLSPFSSNDMPTRLPPCESPHPPTKTALLDELSLGRVE